MTRPPLPAPWVAAGRLAVLPKTQAGTRPANPCWHGWDLGLAPGVLPPTAVALRAWDSAAALAGAGWSLRVESWPRRGCRAKKPPAWTVTSQRAGERLTQRPGLSQTTGARSFAPGPPGRSGVWLDRSASIKFTAPDPRFRKREIPGSPWGAGTALHQEATDQKPGCASSPAPCRASPANSGLPGPLGPHPTPTSATECSFVSEPGPGLAFLFSVAGVWGWTRSQTGRGAF